MKKIKYLFLVLIACTVSGCGHNSLPQQESSTVKEELSIEVAEPTKQITILAAGDNLIHDTIYYQAAARANGQGYDFTAPYELVAPYIQKADIAVLNQETPLASDLYPLSNYPRFNSPKQVGQHMVDIGFDVFNHANNHVFDMGAGGLKATLDFWDTQENVIAVGAYRNEKEKDQIKYLERNGLKIAFLGFAEHTNGLSLPQDSKLGVVKTVEEVALQKQIKKAEENSDIVVVNVHWGNEGSFEVHEAQQQLAKKMANWGADLILGHHPHVLQGGEYITRENGEKSYVIYSLGNFISAQARPENMPAGMLLVEFEQKDKHLSPQISKVDFIPTVTHYGAGMSNIRIIPFKEYSQELANGHGVRKGYPIFSYEYIENVFAHMSLEHIVNQ